jgi:hypothetical protein
VQIILEANNPRLSELAGLILAAQKRLFNRLAQFSDPLILVESGIRIGS